MLHFGAAGRHTTARMKAKRQFPEDILAVLRQGKGLRIRAGTSQHRFIGIWVVVVKDRAFTVPALSQRGAGSRATA